MYTQLTENTVAPSPAEGTPSVATASEEEREARQKLYRWYTQKVGTMVTPLLLVMFAPPFMNVLCLVYRYWLFNGFPASSSSPSPSPYSYADVLQVVVYCKLVMLPVYWSLQTSRLLPRNYRLAKGTWVGLVPLGAALAALSCTEFFAYASGNLLCLHAATLLAFTHLRLDTRAAAKGEPAGWNRLRGALDTWRPDERFVFATAVVGALLYWTWNPRVGWAAAGWCVLVTLLWRMCREAELCMEEHDRNYVSSVLTVSTGSCLLWLIPLQLMVIGISASGDGSGPGFMAVGFGWATLCVVLETLRNCTGYLCLQLLRAHREQWTTSSSEKTSVAVGSETGTTVELWLMMIAWIPFAAPDLAQDGTGVTVLNWLGYAAFGVAMNSLDLLFLLRKRRHAILSAPPPYTIPLDLTPLPDPPSSPGDNAFPIYPFPAAPPSSPSLPEVPMQEPWSTPIQFENV